MNYKLPLAYRCLALILIAMAFVPAFAAKPANLLRDLHFRYVVGRPGVYVKVDWDKKKKPNKKDKQPVFYVNGQQTLGTLEEDGTYFVRINSIQRWSVKSPVTYSVTMEQGEEKITRSFGIRDLGARQGMISLNDTTIMRKGLTESALPLSTCKSQDQWYSYFRDIKSKGFSIVSLKRSSMSQEMMSAADKVGIIVHARIPAPEQKIDESVGKKKKKNKKKKGDTDAEALSLEEEFIQHPSLCMATFAKGAAVENSEKYLNVMVFAPTLPEKGHYFPDYAEMVDTMVVCMADLSELTDKSVLEQCMEKSLCTDGVGALLFSSEEQASAWKDFMILGKFDRDEWDSSMAINMKLYVSNNTEKDIKNTIFTWKFADETGFEFSPGDWNGHRFLPFNTECVTDRVFTPVGHIFPGSNVTLTVKMDGTDYQRSWTHKILYPARIRYMNEEIHKRMKEWCKRGADESDQEYGERVNDVTKSLRTKLWAYEISTEQAGDLVKGKAIKLSRYSDHDESVTLTVDGMTPFKLKVPKRTAQEFCQENDLELRNTKYGLTNKDTYEIVYTEVFNKRTGEVAIYENFDNEYTLERLLMDDKYVPEELKLIAEREDKVLQEIKQRVIQSAKEQNLITDHTKISVNAHVVTGYDEKGNTQNNYRIVFDYNVDARYSMNEDYGPGRYRIEDSHAAISMLRAITYAFGKDFGRYIVPGKKLNISITGSADSSPIRGSIAYDGCYGEFQNVPYYLGQQESKVTITQKEGIRQNEQLAYMRAQGVHDFLSKNLTAADEMDVRYLYNIELPKGKGGQFRRIKVSFTFIDAF